MKAIITEIFCFVDEFCKIFDCELAKSLIADGKRLRKPTNHPALAMS